MVPAFYSLASCLVVSCPSCSDREHQLLAAVGLTHKSVGGVTPSDLAYYDEPVGYRVTAHPFRAWRSRCRFFRLPM